MKPRYAAIALGPFPVATGGLRLGKMRQHKAAIEKKREIIAERAMPVVDADPMPLRQNTACFEIAIDREAQLATVRIARPTRG